MRYKNAHLRLTPESHHYNYHYIYIYNATYIESIRNITSSF